MAALPPGPLLADASFLIGVAEGHPDAARFAPRLSGSVATAINFGEVLSKLAERAGITAGATQQAFINILGITVEPVDLAVVRHFPDLEVIDAASRTAQTGAGIALIKSLPLADMTCLAYATEHGLPVLADDKHWLTLPRHGLQAVVFDFRDRALVP